MRFDLVLQPGHLVRRLVRIVHGEFVVAVEDRLFGGDAEHHVFPNIQLGDERRLLWQVADLGPFGDEAFAGEFLVDAGHDAEQRRLTGAVDAEHADLGVRVEGEVNVVEHLLAGRVGLGQALHMIDELPRHLGLFSHF